jgi:hypothetical protein
MPPHVAGVGVGARRQQHLHHGSVPAVCRHVQAGALALDKAMGGGGDVGGGGGGIIGVALNLPPLSLSGGGGRNDGRCKAGACSNRQLGSFSLPLSPPPLLPLFPPTNPSRAAPSPPPASLTPAYHPLPIAANPHPRFPQPGSPRRRLRPYRAAAARPRGGRCARR